MSMAWDEYRNDPALERARTRTRDRHRVRVRTAIRRASAPRIRWTHHTIRAEGGE